MADKVTVHQRLTIRGDWLAQVSDEIAMEGLRKAAQAMEPDAKRRNPDDTYATEQSIQTRVEPRGGVGGLGRQVVGEIRTNSGHGIWTEIGWTPEGNGKPVRPWRYLRRSARKAMGAFHRELYHALGKHASPVSETAKRKQVGK